ncbi:hypothetical protein D3C71_2185800 [compost metagenome]
MVRRLELPGWPMALRSEAQQPLPQGLQLRLRPVKMKLQPKQQELYWRKGLPLPCRLRRLKGRA